MCNAALPVTLLLFLFVPRRRDKNSYDPAGPDRHQKMAFLFIKISHYFLLKITNS